MIYEKLTDQQRIAILENSVLETEARLYTLECELEISEANGNEELALLCQSEIQKLGRARNIYLDKLDSLSTDIP